MTGANYRGIQWYRFSWLILLILIIIGATMYVSGFRLTPRLVPVRGGAIEISANRSGIQVFVDNRGMSTETLSENRFAVRGILPGLHSILISKDGFWPWMKTVSVEAQKTSLISAAIFPINAAPAPIPAADDSYKKFSTLVSDASFPHLSVGADDYTPEQLLSAWIKKNVANPKFSDDGTTALWADGKSIYVGWISETLPPPHYFCETGNSCRFILPVIDVTTPIRSVDFYDKRSDVIIFAAGTTLYSIEVSRDGVQNFQPFYRGKEPAFYKDQNGALYVKDGSNVFLLAV